MADIKKIADEMMSENKSKEMKEILQVLESEYGITPKKQI